MGESGQVNPEQRCWNQTKERAARGKRSPHGCLVPACFRDALRHAAAMMTRTTNLKVKESSVPDLNVRKTTFPTRCGEWQVVTAFPDFEVQIVTSFEAFAISDAC